MELLDDVCPMESRFGLFRNSVSFDARYVHGFAPNAPQSKKPFWTHLLVLLGEGAQVDARFSLFGDSANLEARQVHGLHGTYQILENQSGRT